MESSDDNDTEVQSVPPVKKRGGIFRGHKRKTTATQYLFVAWVAFVAIWLFFFAGNYPNVWQNIAVVLSSFLIAGGIVGMIWNPRQRRVQATIAVGIGWMVFDILWLAFFWEIFGLIFSRNLAILLVSFLVMLLLIGGIWISGPGEIQPSDRRGRGAVVVLVGWLAFIVYWLWFQAEFYAANVDLTVGLISTLVAFVIMTGLFYSEIREERRGMMGPGLFILWLVILIFWFYFFAGTIDNVYQNIAIVLVSLMLIAGAAAAMIRRDWKDFEAMDFPDDDE